MMFFVTERRLQAIIEADRSQQRIVQDMIRAEEIRMDAHRLAEMNAHWLESQRWALLATHPDPLTDARLTAKKAATKAARPVRKPREKK